MQPDNPASMQIADTDVIYMPLHPDAPAAGLAVQHGLAYGPHQRHRLDVAGPAVPDVPRPVLAFVHGGGYVSGERSRQGTPFNDNVMLWAARHGMVGVNVSYRLAPDHPWPSGGEDVLRAMEWLAGHVHRWGGDPGRMVVFGHSAGASHVAEALAQAFQTGAQPPWAATVLLSGIYALELVGPSPGRDAYYGRDVAQWPLRSSACRIADVKTQLMVLSSEGEPGEFPVQARHLCDAVRRQGGAVECRVLDGHNHFSPVLSIGSTDDSFTCILSAFVLSVPALPDQARGATRLLGPTDCSRPA